MLTSLSEIQLLTNQLENTQTRAHHEHHKQHALTDTIQRIIQCCIREKLLPYSITDNKLEIFCKNANVSIVCDHITQYACMRIDFNSEILIQNGHLRTHIDSLQQLFKILEAEWSTANKSQLHKFLNEVTNSYENMSIVLEHFSMTQHCLKSLFGNVNLIDLVYKLPTDSKALFFEQWATQGHPFHPCIKVKFGLTQEDLVAYCPEFSPQVKIPLYAIHHSIAATEIEEHSDFQDFFNKNYPEHTAKFNKYLTERCLNSDDFFPLFVHPWQEQNILKKIYNDFLKNKKLIKITKCSITLRPSLSFRTLYADKNNFQIKLPTTVLCTGAIRTLSRNTIHNSPRISKVLRNILNTQPHQLNSLRLLFDSVALRINTNDFEKDKQLGMLFRDSISSHVYSSEIPIISAALFSKTLKENTPLICEIINAYYKNQFPEKKEVISYFSKLCTIILEPNLYLYLKHGIALEGHQQNSVIVFENDTPKSILIKDLGGVRIHDSTLINSGYTLSPYPDSVTITSDLTEVRNKLFHAAYQSLLAEIIIVLVRYYKVNELDLWLVVKNITLNILKDCDLPPSQYHQECEALICHEWPIKSFIAMRLADTYANYIYSSTNNPMTEM